MDTTSQGMGRRERVGGHEVDAFSRRARRHLGTAGRGTVKTAVRRRERRQTRQALAATAAW